MILTLRRVAAFPVLLLLGACSHGTANSPSLAPRAAEKIDPRVPIERALTERPMSGGIRERLASLMAQARRGDAAYRTALGPAQRAVAAAGPAGPARSESWISAQVAISALEAARSPTPAALSAIDAIAGEAVAAKGAIGASDLAAVQAAGADAGAIDAEQRATIASLNERIAR